MNSSESYQLESLGSDNGKPIKLEYAKSNALRRRTRAWEVVKIIIRLIGTLCGLISLFTIVAWYADDPGMLSSPPIWTTAPATFGGILWDLAEYTTLYARRGRGITPKAHIGVELILSVGNAAGMGVATWLLIENVSNWTNKPLSANITIIVALTLASLARIILFIRACAERSQEIKRRRPRIMYVPQIGQAFYVVAKSSSALPPQSSLSAQQPRQRVLHHPASNATSPQEPQAMHPPPRLPSPTPRSPAPTYISRRPVPTRKTHEEPPLPPLPAEHNTKSQSNAPPPDYVPDEAEVERRRRGDAQPQLILPEHMDLKFSTSVTGMTPVDSNAQEGKFLVETPTTAGASGPSRTQPTTVTR